ncbi:MAG: amino acid kinase family protein, partial [Candidatus Ranarchaeia archaeon]
VECDVIKKLIEDDHLVIACGGGGIPVIRDNAKFTGIEAVVDKDFTAQLLATLVDADLLVIVMEEDGVYLNYGTKDQKKMDKLTLEEAKFYLKENYFRPGSMAPKIEATIRFLECGGDKAIITSWKDVAKVATEETGTIIVK